VHEEEKMRALWVMKAVKVVAIVVVATTVLGFIVMSLWNWLAPAVFGLHEISFWQALGILILSKILFGGFRGGPGRGGPWRGRMRERWQQMTPEEREKLRQGIRAGCGRRGGVAGSVPEEPREARPV
jgi:hypothetical protein